MARGASRARARRRARAAARAARRVPPRRLAVVRGVSARARPRRPPAVQAGGYLPAGRGSRRRSCSRAWRSPSSTRRRRSARSGGARRPATTSPRATSGASSCRSADRSATRSFRCSRRRRGQSEELAYGTAKADPRVVRAGRRLRHRRGTHPAPAGARRDEGGRGRARRPRRRPHDVQRVRRNAPLHRRQAAQGARNDAAERVEAARV